jgi:hypothetical protein
MARHGLQARRALAALALGAVVGAVALGVEVAGSNDDRARPDGRTIEGVWQGIVTIRDCSSQTALFSFAGMDIYLQGGGLLSESSSPPSVRATGMGAWRHLRGSIYTSAYQFFTYDPMGNPTGVIRVSGRIRLNAEATGYQSSTAAVVTDVEGNTLEHVCGTVEARRFQ